MKTEELWKDIEGYSNYEVSDCGRVRNKKYNRLVKPVKTNSGYYTVSLTDGKKMKVFTIQKLVAKAFVPNPENYYTLIHKDGNINNNRADNLEWSTKRKDNTGKVVKIVDLPAEEKKNAPTYMQRYYAANRERYLEKYREHGSTYKKEYYEKNKEKKRAYQREYYRRKKEMKNKIS